MNDHQRRKGIVENALLQWIVCGFLSFAASIPAQTPTEACGDRLVPAGSLTTVGRGRRPDLTVDASGGLLVVWSSRGGNIVWTRAFDRRGRPVGDPMRANTQQAGHEPRVASDAAGRVLTVWQSSTDDTTNRIVGRAFDVGGTPQGAVRRIDREPQRTKGAPALDRNPRGETLVLWESSSLQRPLIRGQRLDVAGRRLGKPWTIAARGDVVFDPAVALDGRGRAVAVWLEYRATTQLVSVRAQRYGSEGKKAGPLIKVSAPGAVVASRPAVAMSPGGKFLVAWAEISSDGPRVLYVRWFTARGQPVGELRQAVDLAADRSAEVAVGMDRFGNSVVAWTAGSDPYVAARVFDLSGGAASDEFRIGRGHSPALDFDANGHVVWVWDEDGQIVAKRFRLCRSSL